MTLLLIAHWGCASSAKQEIGTGESTGVVNYADTKHGIRLTYAGQWKEQNLLKPRGAVLVLVAERETKGLPPTVSIIAQPQQKNAVAPDLSLMERRLIERAQNQIGNFALVEASDTTVGGEPARRVTYTGRKLGMDLQVMNILTVHDGRGYAIAYMADPAAFGGKQADVDRMIESIEWLK